jgi:hypothetical protein
VEAVRDALVRGRLAEPDEAQPPPLPVEPVLTELPCLKCGYSLVGLTSEMNCPECGWSVADSMKGDLLQFAGDEELARLNRGALLVEASLICSVVLGLFGGLVGAAMGVAGGQGGLPAWLPGALNLGAAFLGISLAAAGVLGWWWLSEPDPARRDGPAALDKGRTWRRVLRSSLLVTLAFTALSAVLQLFPQFANSLVPQQPVQPVGPGPDGVTGLPAVFPPLSGWLITYVAVTSLTFVAQILVSVSSMMYLRTIAPRVPSVQLERFCKMLAWLGPLLSTVGILLCGLGPIAALIMTIVAIEMLRGPVRTILVQRSMLAGSA